MASASEDATINEPVDMVRLSLDDRILVKCRCARMPHVRLHTLCEMECAHWHSDFPSKRAA